MNLDSTKKISQGARRFFTGTLASRITGMIRDVSMASYFGADPHIAAFMVAFRFSHLLRRIFGEGCMQSAFIPHYEELRLENPRTAYQLFLNLNASILAILLLIIASATAVIGSAIGLGLFSPENQEVASLTLIMLPSLLFICLFGVNMALLQCNHHYFTPGFAPVCFNVIWISAIYFLRNSSPALAMKWLAFSIIIACFLQWLITVPETWRICRPHIKSFTVRIFSSDVIKLFVPVALGILGVAAEQINGAMDSIFARESTLAGPAYLWYSIRLQQLPLALFGIAFSGALLPPLARAMKNGKMQDAIKFLRFGLTSSLTFVVPVSFACLVLGPASINLLYGHGEFNSLDILNSTRCLWGYALGLAPMVIILVIAPAFYSQGRYGTTSIASVSSVVINLSLNTLFIYGLSWPTESVAYATSLSAWWNLCFLIYKVQKNVDPKLMSSIFPHFVKITMASFGALASAIWVDSSVLSKSPFQETIWKLSPQYSSEFSQQCTELLLPSLAFFLVYGVLIKTLRINGKTA
jgi:putative peptidoglycan lipid II flippase